MRIVRAAAFLCILAACGPAPTPTQTACPSPDPMTLTYENFGRDFMAKYCNWCHRSDLTRSKRNGAPLYHDYDTLLGVLQTPDHIDEQAGHGPAAKNEFMPPDACPGTPGGSADSRCAKPTAEERRQLAEWIACERNRPHDFSDAGIDAP